MADDMEAAFGTMPDHWGIKFTNTYHINPTDTISPKNNNVPEGYVALVTESDIGIGEYIARSYIEAGAGGIVLTGRRAGPLEETKANLEKLAAESGREVKVTFCSGDAEKNETYVGLKQHLEKEHGGRLDALVCHAGQGNSTPASWTAKIHETAAAEWESVIAVNLHGPYYAAKHLIPLMLKAPSQGKTIVNIVSGALHMTTGTPPISYSIGKLGETRLSQHIGEMYKDEDLQAFALHPGAVRTSAALSHLPPGMHGVLIDSIELAGNVCVWLSSKRPAWLSGRYLSVNWDYDELSAQKDEIVSQDKFKFTMTV